MRVLRILLTFVRLKHSNRLKMEFTLKGYDYIELNNLLKAMNLVGSGGEANMFIISEEVLVNGEVETRKRKKLRAGDKVTFNGQTIEVK